VGKTNGEVSKMATLGLFGSVPGASLVLHQVLFRCAFVYCTVPPMVTYRSGRIQYAGADGIWNRSPELEFKVKLINAQKNRLLLQISSANFPPGKEKL